jgi:hypothetical protein
VTSHSAHGKRWHNSVSRNAWNGLRAARNARNSGTVNLCSVRQLKIRDEIDYVRRLA